MDHFDDSSPLHFPSIPDEDSLYRDMMASLQALNVDQDSDETEWCEELQLQQALMSCAYELQQASMSCSGVASSSPSSSSSSSPAPCPPPSTASSTEASNSAATRSFSCALCLEKYDRGFFQVASPCDHLFCQFCLGVTSSSSSSSEDIACIMDGCNGYLTDDSSPLHFPSIPDEDSLYGDMMASLQLLNVHQDSNETEWCEALQLQQALMSCAYELQQASMSCSEVASSSSAVPSSSSLPAPCPPPSAEASNSAATRSFSCALCLEKYDRGFFQVASPCDHLFCQFCLGVTSSSSSEDIACIMDGCNGYLTPMYKSKMCVATPCNLEVLPTPSMTDVAKIGAHETT